MKELNLPFPRRFFTRSVDTWSEALPVSFGTMDIGAVSRGTEVARSNGSVIISAVTHLESRMEDLLEAVYFNPSSVDWRRSQFRDDFVQPHGFEFKRQRVSAALKSLDGIPDDAVVGDNDLAKLQRWRNTFAHGEITYRADVGHIIADRRHEFVLDESFWDDVKETFERTRQALDKAIAHAVVTWRKDVDRS